MTSTAPDSAPDAMRGSGSAGSSKKAPGLSRFASKSSVGSSSNCGESLQLKWRGTFIHVADQAEEEQARNLRRSASDSDLVSINSGSNFQEDQASVDQLADKLSSFWSVNAPRRSVGAADGGSVSSTNGESEDARPYGFAGGVGSDSSMSRRMAAPAPVTPGYFGSMTPNAEEAVVATATAATRCALSGHLGHQDVLASNLSESQLKTQIHENVKEISSIVHVHQRKQALSSIQELPEQVEEALNVSANTLLSEVQDKVAILADIVRERDTTGEAETAVESLEVIPDMMKDSLDATVQKAKGIVREHVDMVASHAESSSTEEILKQVRALPAQVHQIAGDVLWQAVVESEKQAAQRLDEVIERLPEESSALEGAKAAIAREVMAVKLPAVAAHGQNGARLAALEPVQQAMAVVNAEKKDLQSAISNQVVADMLLRVKASQSDSAPLSPRTLHKKQLSHSPKRQHHPRKPLAHLAPEHGTQHGRVDRDRGEPDPAKHLPPAQPPTWPPVEGVPQEPAPQELRGDPPFIIAALELCGGNPGSIGHPDLCPRPCLFFAQGTCTNGTDCEFCHLPHPKRPAHLDKRHREMIKRMSLVQVGDMLLPILRDKIQGLQQDQGASLALLQDLATLCGCSTALDDDRPQQRPSSAERLLLVALQAMSLRLLLTSMHRSIPSENSAARRQVDRLLNHLRVAAYWQLVERAGFADEQVEGAPMPVFMEHL